MTIDPNEIKSIEDSMVHDAEEDPSKLQGVAVYLTLRLISKIVLGVYGVMLAAMLALQLALRGGEKLPVSLSPESVLMALPVAIVAIIFYFSGEAEPEIEKKRTKAGLAITFSIVFVLMQVVSVVLWVVVAKMFELK